jgi:Tfp pilus assembly protein PilF
MSIFLTISGVLAGIVLGTMFCMLFLFPTFYFAPKAIWLVLRRDIRPLAILKTAMAPAIFIAVCTLIGIVFPGNNVFGYIVTFPGTNVAANITMVLLCFRAVITTSGRKAMTDRFWDKMQRYIIFKPIATKTRDPKYLKPWLYIDRGDEKYEHSRYIEAKADYDYAIKLAPKSAAAYCRRADANLSLGKRTDAIADFDKAIALDGWNAFTYQARGFTKCGMGLYEDAVADYDRAIELKPKQASYYSKRAWVKNNLGRYQDAITDCEKAIEIDPVNPHAYNNRGYAYYKIGGAVFNLRQAVADYETAQKLGGNRFWPDFKYRRKAKAELKKAMARAVKKRLMLTQNENCPGNFNS